MSFSVNVRLGELSSTTSLSELSASVTISGGLLRSIPFSANKDTDLEFADTITFSVDNPDSSIFYYWEVENENGYKRALGQSVKQDYAAEGSYDVNLIASNTNSIEGVNFKQDFVKVDFDISLQLLDDVPGAAAAYSIRLLRQDYSGGLLRVRAVDSNGTDQGEADVQDLPLSDGRYIDLNSPIENLDSTAQGRGLSNSDTLADLVDNGGANYDGFIPTWYDQSPNAYHATNSTASEQPKLVSAGSLITTNNKPKLQFDGSDDILTGDTQTTSDKLFAFMVADNVSDKWFGNSYGAPNKTGFFIGNNVMQGRWNSNGNYDSLTASVTQSHKLHSIRAYNGLTEWKINGNADSINDTGPYKFNQYYGLGGEEQSGSTIEGDRGACELQEVVIYKTNILSSQSKVESLMNNSYNIF